MTIRPAVPSPGEFYLDSMIYNKRETMSSKLIQGAFERGQGIFRLFPAFVPYRFNQAGGRLRLHPDDLFPL